MNEGPPTTEDGHLGVMHFGVPREPLVRIIQVFGSRAALEHCVRNLALGQSVTVRQNYSSRSHTVLSISGGAVEMELELVVVSDSFGLEHFRARKFNVAILDDSFLHHCAPWLLDQARMVFQLGAR